MGTREFKTSDVYNSEQMTGNCTIQMVDRAIAELQAIKNMKEYANTIMNALAKQGVDTITSMKLSDMITSPKMSFETLTSIVNNPNGPLSSEARVLVDKATKSMEVAKQIQDNQLNK